MLKHGFIISACTVAAAVICSATASGQPYPNKLIHIFASDAGSNLDLVARVVAQGLTANLGRQVVVDNRPGIVAIETAAKAAPDGYTLLFYTNAVWTLPLMKEISVDPARQLQPITLATNAPLFLYIHPSVAAKSVQELIALAKARPGQLNYGMAGSGTSNHLAGELLKYMTGTDIVCIPYKGAGPATVALLGGQVQILFSSAATGMSHVATGRLKVLAVASAKPSVLAPDVPTVAASGVPGYEVTSISAMWAPVNTPKAIVSQLNQETLRVLNSAEVQEKFVSYATETIGNSPEQASAYINADTAKWRKLIKDVGIRAD